MLSKAKYENALLEAHRLHSGLYRRVANKLGVDCSYVSRVAVGQAPRFDVPSWTNFMRYNVC